MVEVSKSREEQHAEKICLHYVAFALAAVASEQELQIPVSECSEAIDQQINFETIQDFADWICDSVAFNSFWFVRIDLR